MPETGDHTGSGPVVHSPVKQGTTGTDIQPQGTPQNTTGTSTAIVPAASTVPAAAAITGTDAEKTKQPATTDSSATPQEKEEISQAPEKPTKEVPAAVVPAVIAVPAAKVISDTEKEKVNKKDTEESGRDTNKEQKKTDSNETAKDDNRKSTSSPMFTVTNDADISSVDAPGMIHYTILIENTGGMPLTGFRISTPLIEDLSGRQRDTGKPNVLDVGETWTYTGSYNVTQAVIDGNGVDGNNAIDGSGNIISTVTVGFTETDPPRKAAATVRVIQNPMFTITKEAGVTKIKEPQTINYTIAVKNTGNVSLNDIRISDPVLDELSGPDDDMGNPGALDVGETWTFSGSYNAPQTVIDANGVDSNNVIDSDGDIDNTVMVDFAETAPPQTAYARVETEPSIDGDIFGKNKNYLHGFFSGTESYISNLYKTDRDPEGCWATFLNPGIWASFSVPSPTAKRSIEIITANASPGGLAINPFNPVDYRPFQAYLMYSPQLQMYHNQKNKAYQDQNIGDGIIDNEDTNQFSDNNSLNRLTHRVDGYLSYYSGNRLFLRAMDQYKISYDAFSDRAYFTDDKYSSNLFSVAGTVDATSKLQLRLDYSNFDLNYKDQPDNDDDRMDNSIGAYLFFRMTEKTSAFVEYEFADINYDTSDKDSYENRYFAGLRWQMTGKSSGQIKGGYGEKTFDTATSILPDNDVSLSDVSSGNWIAEIQLDHNLNSRTNLTLNAYRRYDEVMEHRYNYGTVQDFYADYTLAHFVGFKISRDLTSKIHIFLDTSYFYDVFKGSRQIDRDGKSDERKDNEFAISPSIKYNIRKWLSLSGAYIYTDHGSNYPTHDYIDHTFFVQASLFL